MQEFFKWFAQHQTIHPVLLASESHYRLVTIHPFVDGNGRTARLFMNLLLLRFGYPPGVIGPKDRLKYIKALEGAQLGGSLESFHQVVYRAVSSSLDLYLDAASGKQPHAVGKLYKIAEFARIAGISVPTLRHWINTELLAPAEVTPSGYSLFSNQQIKIIKEIQKWQEKRLSLIEIKQKIAKNT
jgi:Fic family protein